MDAQTPLVNLAIDSLVAVEIRTWFQRELGVDVPVVKILGGASVGDLVEDVMGKLGLGGMGREEGEGREVMEMGASKPKPVPEPQVPVSSGEKFRGLVRGVLRLT